MDAINDIIPSHRKKITVALFKKIQKGGRLMTVWDKPTARKIARLREEGMTPAEISAKMREDHPELYAEEPGLTDSQIELLFSMDLGRDVGASNEEAEEQEPPVSEE